MHVGCVAEPLHIHRLILIELQDHIDKHQEDYRCGSTSSNFLQPRTLKSTQIKLPLPLKPEAVPTHDPHTNPASPPPTESLPLDNEDLRCIDAPIESLCGATDASTSVITSGPVTGQDQIEPNRSLPEGSARRSFEVVAEEDPMNEWLIQSDAVLQQKSPSWKDLWGLRRSYKKSSSTSRIWHSQTQAPVTPLRPGPSVAPPPTYAESSTEAS